MLLRQICRTRRLVEVILEWICSHYCSTRGVRWVGSPALPTASSLSFLNHLVDHSNAVTVLFKCESNLRTHFRPHCWRYHLAQLVCDPVEHAALVHLSINSMYLFYLRDTVCTFKLCAASSKWEVLAESWEWENVTFTLPVFHLKQAK